jgi:hypothetical protein
VSEQIESQVISAAEEAHSRCAAARLAMLDRVSVAGPIKASHTASKCWYIRSHMLLWAAAATLPKAADRDYIETHQRMARIRFPAGSAPRNTNPQ